MNDVVLRLYERDILRRLNSADHPSLRDAEEGAARGLERLGFSDEAVSLAVVAFETLRSASTRARGVLNPRILFRDYTRRLFFFLIRAQADRFRSLAEQLLSSLPEASRFVLFGSEDILLAAFLTREGATNLERQLSVLSNGFTPVEIDETYAFEGHWAREPELAKPYIDAATLNVLVDDFDAAVDVDAKRKLLDTHVILGPAYDEDLSATGRARAFIDATLGGSQTNLEKARAEFVEQLERLPDFGPALRGVHAATARNRFILDLVCDDVGELARIATAIRTQTLPNHSGAHVETATYVVADGHVFLPHYLPAGTPSLSLLIDLEPIDLVQQVRELYGDSLSAEKGQRPLSPRQKLLLVTTMLEAESEDMDWLPQKKCDAVRAALAGVVRGVRQVDAELAMKAVAGLCASVEAFLRDALRQTLRGLFGTEEAARPSLDLPGDAAFSRYQLKHSLNAFRRLRGHNVGGNLAIALKPAVLAYIDHLLLYRNPVAHQSETIGWEGNASRILRDSHDAVHAALRVMIGVEQDILHFAPLQRMTVVPRKTAEYMSLIEGRPSRGVLFDRWKAHAARVEESSILWGTVRGLNAVAQADQREPLTESLRILGARRSAVSRSMPETRDCEEFAHIVEYILDRTERIPARLVADLLVVSLFYASWEMGIELAGEYTKVLPGWSRE